MSRARCRDGFYRRLRPSRPCRDAYLDASMIAVALKAVRVAGLVGRRARDEIDGLDPRFPPFAVDFTLARTSDGGFGALGQLSPTPAASSGGAPPFR